MDGIVPEMRWSAKERLVKRLRKIREVKLRTRYLIVINLVRHCTASETAGALSVGRSTVYRVAQRFREAGEAGLMDRREENGNRKRDERYLATLYETVRLSPQTHGWLRPTWTREMLVETLRRKTATCIPLLRARSSRLKDAGVAFTDLTGVFADHPEPIYNDFCCHVELAGDLIMAKAIAARIKQSGSTNQRISQP